MKRWSLRGGVPVRIPVRVAVLAILVGLGSTTSAIAQTPSPDDVFEEAVKTLVAKVKKAAPKGVTVKVKKTTPGALGWTSRAKTPLARVLELSAPNGACWAFGLLPRRGAHKTVKDPPRGVNPGFVSVGPALIVVEAPQPEVALTLEAQEAATKLLDVAAAPFLSWGVGKPIAVEDRPAGLRAAKDVVKHPHFLKVVLPPDVKIDLGAIEKLGFTAVAMRRHPAWAWTVVVRPPSPR